jgi:hypothetical protein
MPISQIALFQSLFSWGPGFRRKPPKHIIVTQVTS